MNKTLILAGWLVVFSVHAQTTNQKPIANAGADQNVSLSTRVTLSAAQSFDRDGTIKIYQWLQTKGGKVVLQNPKSAAPSFVSSKKVETLVFKLTVTDNQNATAFDLVNINVQNGCELPNVMEKKICVDKSTQAKLNDTGITFCTDGAFNVDSCQIASYPRQDAEFGRDFFNNDDQDGHAGFSFSKISATGEKLSLNAPVWSCVKDNVTGLLWEVKTAENANFNYRYAETEPFIQSTNTKKLCGMTNWRLPEIQELQGIIDYSVPLPNPSIDMNFFPNSTNQLYWSATSYAKNVTDIWAIYFNDGRVFEQDKNTSAAIRLVSFAQKVTAKNYVISDDKQEVLDTQTGLIWRRCVEGMTWNGATCAGEPFGGMLQESLERAASQARLSGKAWRLPNIKELASLVDTTQPNLAIDSTIFPATPNDQVWSSSSYAVDAFFGWVVHFYYGSSYYTYLEDTGVVRLVKN
ncbi:MAG: DUF1566 domain-containing protein [Methylococcaceae bacterium]